MLSIRKKYAMEFDVAFTNKKIMPLGIAITDTLLI